MAAAVFAARMQERGFDCRVESAGCRDYKFRAAVQWSQLEETKQYDLSRHVGRYIGHVPYTADTLFVCLDEDVAGELSERPDMVRSNILLLNPPEGVYDPQSAQTLAAYRECFKEITAGIDHLMQELFDA